MIDLQKETMKSLFTKIQKTPPSESLFLFPGTGLDAPGESHFE